MSSHRLISLMPSDTMKIIRVIESSILTLLHLSAGHKLLQGLKKVEDYAAECHPMGICIIRFILIFVIIFKQT